LDRFSREGALATLRYLKEFKDHGVHYKSFTEPYLDSLGPFGDVIVSMLATIAAQDLIKFRRIPRRRWPTRKRPVYSWGLPLKAQKRWSRYGV
jgi:DNA invertase Pin-like site-specific DNA recombinase